MSAWRRAGAAALLAASCLVRPAAAQGLFDDNEARRRIEVLRQQLESTQKSLEDRMSKVEAGATDRNAVLDLASQINAMRDDMAKMRGQIEVMQNQLDAADKRQKDLYLDIDTRLRKLEQAGEKAASAATAATNPEAAASPEENKAYQAALDQFKLGNYPLAVAAMQGFLVTYPNSPLAANAQYWIGMAYSGQRDYKSSISAQRKLLTNWPDSQKAPDAMLSIASSQETIGDRKAASRTLEDLIAKYPNSSPAASAKQRLSVLKKR